MADLISKTENGDVEGVAQELKSGANPDNVKAALEVAKVPENIGMLATGITTDKSNENEPPSPGRFVSEMRNPDREQSSFPLIRGWQPDHKLKF